ncbi:hypothetical protein PRIPAC_75237 [Pristionchus pacificus]|uniref:Uncharacterized protein n=1 Tax=Pristionchus pacificus TaxID=54126 RepID=A0A2A6BG75_PRIPA|nr:hypothetical protein PRIPAC_75237 [Pristionchus pacificus]|eukprot:PDM64894.1 hypothetical protein PRIPAC_53150 [Pristionchus pacificus]
MEIEKLWNEEDGLFRNSTCDQFGENERGQSAREAQTNDKICEGQCRDIDRAKEVTLCLRDWAHTRKNGMN